MAITISEAGRLVVVLGVLLAVVAWGMATAARQNTERERPTKYVTCKDSKHHRYCSYRRFRCPRSCPYSCSVNCVSCRPVCDCDKPGAVCQDPKFIGADGITFYFHGKKDRDFCVVADSNLHVNAHFIGRRNPTMQRDFTWVQSLGILFDTHTLFVGAMKTADWEDSVDRLALSFNGEPVYLPLTSGATWNSTSGGISITRLQETNSIEMEAEGKFKIKAVVVPITQSDSLIHNYGITDDDCFAHLDLTFKFYALTADVDGVLGQTYASNYVSRVNIGALMPVLGGKEKFTSSSIFSTDCSVAKFVGKGNRTSDLGSLVGDLSCTSGVGGPGVVCKR